MPNTRAEKLILHSIATKKLGVHLLTITKLPPSLIQEGIHLARLRQAMCAVNMGYAHAIAYPILTNETASTDNLTKEDLGGIGEALVKSLLSDDAYQTPYIDDFEAFTHDHRLEPDFRIGQLTVDIKTVSHERHNIAVTCENINHYNYLIAIRLIPNGNTFDAQLFLYDTNDRKNWQTKEGVKLSDGRQKPDYYLIPLHERKPVND